jgi:hypothetical protein
MPSANTIIYPQNMPGNAATAKPRAERFTGKPSQRKRQQLAAMSMDLRPVRLFISVDPSITRTGWAVWCGTLMDYGSFSPSEAKGAKDRNTQLAEYMADLMRDYAPVGRLVIETSERPGYGGGRGMGTKQATVFGRAVGDIEGAAAAMGIEVRPVDVREWKGNASKETTLAHCRALGLKPETLDESDAIGLGLWYLRQCPALAMAASAIASAPHAPASDTPESSACEPAALAGNGSLVGNGNRDNTTC